MESDSAPVPDAESDRLRTKPGWRELPGDRYFVIGELGRGGMGEVVRAYDATLQREVALKRLMPGTRVDESDESGLVREARAMAQLSHRNVVAVYDVEVSSRGVTLVMEYVPGQTLRHWLRTPRPWHEILSAFVQAGHGLAAAHNAGLVHGDFKPANILMTDAGLAKVTDFGIATPAGDSSASSDSSAHGDDHDSSENQVLGTPRYMAPEQHAGAEVDERTDEFAFCVAAWEALNGRPPFTGHLRSLIEAKSRGPGAWPPQSRIPGPIAAAITRGLSPDPDERFSTMDGLLRILEYEPARRRRLVVWGGATALLASAGMAGLWGWRSDQRELCTGARGNLAGVWDEARRSDVERSIESTGVVFASDTWERLAPRLEAYASQWVEQHNDACEATAVRGEQSAELMDLRMACLGRARAELNAAVDLFANADPEVVRRAVRVIEALPSPARCSEVETLRAEPTPRDAEVADAVERVHEELATARALQSAGKYVAALPSARRLHARAQSLEYPPLRAETALTLGVVLEGLGNYEESIALLEDAMSIALRHGMTRLASTAGNSLLFARGYRLQRFSTARATGHVALGLARRLRDPILLAGVHGGIAALLDTQGNYQEAEVHSRRAVEFMASAPRHSRNGTVHNNLGTILQALGRTDEAVVEHRRALELFREHHGPDHPEVASTHNNIGNALFTDGRYEDAEAEYKLALSLRERVLGPDHPQVAGSHGNLGTALKAQKRYAEAEAEYRIGLGILEQTVGPGHSHVAGLRNNLGAMLSMQGKYRAAEAEHQRALDIRLEALGPDHPEVASSHHNLGLALRNQGRHEEAIRHFERALAIRARSMGDPGSIGDVAFALARLVREGDETRARDLAEQARRAYAIAGEAEAESLRDVERWLDARR